MSPFYYILELYLTNYEYLHRAFYINKPIEFRETNWAPRCIPTPGGGQIFISGCHKAMLSIHVQRRHL